MHTAPSTLQLERHRLREQALERGVALRLAWRDLREPLRHSLQAATLLPRLLPEIGAALCAVLLLRQLQQRRYGALWWLGGALDLWRLYRTLQAYRRQAALSPPAAR